MRRAATICLVLSGAAGLLDEVVWGRGVGVLLGSTAEAHALTLGVFLGGLALGAALLGRYADRTPNPLRLYGWLELGVALTTVATPAALRLATQLFQAAAAPLNPEDQWTIGALKAAFALALLLPPTLLMGGTLPVMVRALVRHHSEIGIRTGLLYAANSAGGVAGTLLGGLFLVPAVGLDKCAVLAAALNVLAAAVAFAAARELPAEALSTPEAPAPSAAPSPPAAPTREEESAAPAPVIAAMLAAMALSGAASLLYETLWIRLLSLVLGGTAHAFPLMLAAFIGGITAGAFWAGRRQRHWEEALRTFVRVEIVAAAVVGLAFGAYQRLPWLILLLGHGAASNETGYLFHLVLSFSLAVAVMALPAACIGATLPLAAQVAAGEVRSLGRKLGGVYAWNTAGNVVGALAGGLVALPLLGMRGAFLVGMVLNVVAGLLPLVATRPALPRLARPALAGVAALLLVGLAPFEPQLLSRGVFRLHGYHPGSFERFREDYLAKTKLLFHQDGANATVEVHEQEDGTRSLRINGKADASTGKDMQTQVLSGHLPMLFHPAPRHVLVIGLGSGVTAAAALRHGPDVRVTMVEISPEVVAAAAHFREVNDDVLADPRVRLVVDDARTFVRLDRQQYDVIITEPSNPWMAGISGLFTADFFRELRARLAPGGVLLQWSQLYETDDTILRLVVRTFRSVYGDATAWGSAGADLLLVSGVDPARLDWAEVSRRMAQPEVAEYLARGRIGLPAALAALQMYSSEALAAYAGEGPVHTDAWPLLEFAGARALFLNGWARDFIEGDQRRKLNPRHTAIASFLAGREPHAEEARAIAEALADWAPHTPELYVSALRRAAEADPAHWPALARTLENGFASFPLVLGRARDLPEGPMRAPMLLDMAEAEAVEQLLQSSAFRRPRLESARAAVREALLLGLEDEARAWSVLARLHLYDGDRRSAREAARRARGIPGDRRLPQAEWEALERELAALEE